MLCCMLCVVIVVMSHEPLVRLYTQLQTVPTELKEYLHHKIHAWDVRST